MAIIYRYNARMTFYTAKGDDGTTGLLGDGRVMKYDARIEAIGTVDESTAALGLARAQCLDPRSIQILLEAQRDLYKLMAEVAATPENAIPATPAPTRTTSPGSRRRRLAPRK